jgi:hypothetical protein
MLDGLNEAEREQVRRALVAAVEGPFFPEWEFRILFGVDRSAVRAALTAFPRLSPRDQDQFLSVNNSLFMLGSYPHEPEADFERYGVRRADIRRVHKKLRQALGLATAKFLDNLE